MSFYNFVPLRKMKINNITKQNIYNNDKKSLYKQKKLQDTILMVLVATLGSDQFILQLGC